MCTIAGVAGEAAAGMMQEGEREEGEREEASPADALQLVACTLGAVGEHYEAVSCALQPVALALQQGALQGALRLPQRDAPGLAAALRAMMLPLTALLQAAPPEVRMVALECLQLPGLLRQDPEALEGVLPTLHTMASTAAPEAHSLATRP